MWRKKLSAAFITAVFLFAINFTVYAADPCDRACMEQTVDNVIQAMIAHSPNQLRLSKQVHYTENGQELRIGDGLWATASAAGKYRLYVTDPESGQIGFLGTVSENGEMNLVALRLKIFETVIEEIEVLVARPNEPTGEGGDTDAGLLAEEKMVKPRPQFLETVPEKERMSREDLIKVANSYFTHLANNTGNHTAPFADTCERYENGGRTTNKPPGKGPFDALGGYDITALGCEEQQKTGWFRFVTDIRNRRFPIVDRERGLVLGFAFFEHNAAFREYTLPNGKTVPNFFKSPLTYEISELFQIRGGKIDQIEAVVITVPYGMTADVWDE